jgi:nucleotide-binding universal stress UspA family protein
VEATPQRIVVGVDGSDGARLVLTWALALTWALGAAARRRAAVEVLAAFPIDFYWIDAYLIDQRWIDTLRADTEARARALVDEVRRKPAVMAQPGADDLDVEVLVCAGGPAAHLVERSDGADLLVVGSRGRGGLRSAVAGSVALHCAAHAPCPVVVVHPDAAPVAEPPRVVVGLDDSDHARRALTAAVTGAARLGARVDAVLAYQAPNYWSDLYAITMPPAGETEDAAVRRGRAIVGEVLGDEAAAAVHVVAVEGHPARVLMRQAEGARLLVLGSRSRNQLEGVVLGSVALHAVMHAPCPVLVVHPSRSGRSPAPQQAAAAPATG